MPQYDYRCLDCQHNFSLILTLKEHEKQIICPKCGSNKVEQQVAAFYAVTSRKSA
jgi:putative FmdB family regulatory protein